MTEEVEFTPQLDYKGYRMVIKANGKPFCSCGRQLEKVDDTTYKCPGGYPIFRFDHGDFFIDKFGNIYLRDDIPHEKEAEDGGK